MQSTSRAKKVAATPVAAKATSGTWQFVNVKKPKKFQDKEVISLVRAHAMRSVRRKQRLELTAQHQKPPKAPSLQQQHHADLGITVEQSLQPNPLDRFIGGRDDTEWLVTVREMLTKLQMRSLGYLPSRNGARNAAEPDEYGESTDYGQSYNEDEIRASVQQILAECRSGNPMSFIGDGASDPFNAMPVAKYHSHVLNHFVSVMAHNCIPVDQHKGQNPLTKIWLPYALQDSTLFQATLSFAEVHLDVLAGNYNSQRAIIHKGHSIRAVNAKLRDSEHALSNETIGAVAMLAASEGIVGNYKDLRVHMTGLQRLVYMRGGLQSLGWDGILHTFISWQDLLSSSMMVSAPQYASTPYCLLVRGSVPYDDPIFSGLGFSTDFCREVATSFQSMRYLTQAVNNGTDFQTASEITAFSETRIDTVHRLQSVANTKPPLEMTNLDYQVEICRLAALTYIKAAIHPSLPLCATICNLRYQLKKLIKQGEVNGTIGVGARRAPISTSWALFVVGSLSLDREEQEWFARRLAKGIRASSVETWSEMEGQLRQICWLDKLSTPACRDLWSKILVINGEYKLPQFRDVTLDQG